MKRSKRKKSKNTLSVRTIAENNSASIDGLLVDAAGKGISGARVDLGAAILAAKETGLLVAGGGHALAMETYLWNSRVAAAGIVDVGHLEIAIRNAYDRELSRRYPEWAVDPQSALFQLEQGVQRARAQQHRRNQASLSRLSDAKRGPRPSAL